MNTIVLKLFRLAKMGQKEEFLSLVQNKGIMNKLQYLNGKELSMIIYGYSKLNLMNQETQHEFEQIYLNSIKKLNVHDHVMCGWSLKNTQNKDVSNALIQSFHQNWENIKQMQQNKANIGLIAYLSANEKNPEDPIWKQIENVFYETMEFQDQKNFMIILYAFSKVQPKSDSIWISLEKYIWGQGFDQFSRRNQVLMVYSFAKVGKGSMQFWEVATKQIPNLKFKFSDDISFCIWAFAKMNINNLQFWEKMINKQLQIWDKVSLADIENTTWALEKVQLANPDIWNQILQQQVSEHQSISLKYNEFDEVLTIGKRLHNLKMDQSPLFLSLQKKINGMLTQNKVNFQSLHRLHFLSVFIEKDNTICNENLIQQIINSFSQNQSYNSNLNLLNSLTLLLQDETLAKFNLNDKFKEVINKSFTNMKFIDFKSSIDQEKYFWIGSYLLQYQENDILPLLTSEQIYEKVENNISHLCSLIKILSKHDNAAPFFNRLRMYENQKPDVFISLFYNMIHKYGYLIPQEKYKKLRNMLKSISQTKDKMEIQNKFIDFILNKNNNIIEEINALLKIQIQDYLKQFQNDYEVDLQKILQEQVSKQRLEFQHQIDLKNHQFIDIVNIDIQGQIEENTTQ
ncbi:unnamed protein product [Paramecium primaurelia]|uniref:Uncharacterized protein n=1 Tax=Paramecium primaurelia TaxID=5886 RepID=A0A8S1MBI1_PARPR|nr:unnamed protein product [Paramecium primaurelia]